MFEMNGLHVKMEFCMMTVSACRFLSERDTADRNFAIAYYLKENQVSTHAILKTKATVDHEVDV